MVTWIRRRVLNRPTRVSSVCLRPEKKDARLLWVILLYLLVFHFNIALQYFRVYPLAIIYQNGGIQGDFEILSSTAFGPRKGASWYVPQRQASSQCYKELAYHPRLWRAFSARIC